MLMTSLVLLMAASNLLMAVPFVVAAREEIAAWGWSWDSGVMTPLLIVSFLIGNALWFVADFLEAVL